MRITDLLDEVAQWTGVADSFTHLRTGLPAGDGRVVLTAVLADATNLGLTRMAEACTIASYRQLAWTAAWHVGEDAYSTGCSGSLIGASGTVFLPAVNGWEENGD